MNIHNPIIEPWTEAADRLRNCGHEIELASDKLVALGNVADSFAPAINEGYLMQANVSDRLHEIAEAYGLYVDYGADAVQSTIADGLDRWQQRQEQQKRKGNGGANGYASPPKGPTNDNAPLVGLREWDAGNDVEIPPPRGWLLGNIFCRGFMSSLLADGGVGKTALRYAQLLSLATGRSLTGDYVFQRCRVLIVSLEDDDRELRRRILAAILWTY